MKILPREHGATVIWLSSVLAAVLTVPTFPSPTRLYLFLGVSTAILLLTAQLTRRSPTLIRIQRNRLFLPIISGSLTLITPLGYYIMFGTISTRILAIWLLLLTYTVVSVTLVQGKVQGLIQRKESSSSYIVPLGLAVFIVESLPLFSSGLLHPAVLLSLAPLLFMWFYLRSRRVLEADSDSKIKVIRRIGFQQTGNMMAFVLILAILSRF
ncbi:MAG: hypothetical protein ACE5KU_06390 [Nitrososphaerales archaeon]